MEINRYLTLTNSDSFYESITVNEYIDKSKIKNVYPRKIKRIIC